MILGQLRTGARSTTYAALIRYYQFYPTKYHLFFPTRYYQWVGFVLLLQGILFLGPYMLWKFLEGGRVIHIHNVIWAVIENIILT